MRTIKSILALAIIAVLLIFIASNTQRVGVDFLSVRLEAPAAVVVLLSSVAGVSLWPLLRAVFQHSD